MKAQGFKGSKVRLVPLLILTCEKCDDTSPQSPKPMTCSDIPSHHSCMYVGDGGVICTIEGRKERGERIM